MALNSDKKYLNKDLVVDLVKALSDKNKTQSIILQTNINANKSAISDEAARALSAETILQSNIQSEVDRAKAEEAKISENLTSQIDDVKTIISDTEKNLQTNIDTEINSRQAEITRVETKYDERIAGLDSAQTNYTDSQINSIAGTLRTEYKNADEVLHAQIDVLDQKLAENKLADANAISSVNDRITAEIDNVEQKIIDHNSQYTTLNTTVQQHIGNENNPHKVTREQLGAASQIDHEALDQRVSVNEALSASNDNRISEIEPQISKAKTDIEGLIVDKVNYNGKDQTISGGLVSDGNFQIKGDTLADGDLRVSGNLIVDGTHQTVDTETLQVQDNFIVVNSDNESLGTTPAGIAIQTGTSPYLIAYDIENQSVSLGVGTQSGGAFGFAEGEKKPILTRANSNQLHDKHLLVWDAKTNTAIDGGLYDEEALKNTFATWAAHNSLVTEVSNNTIDIDKLQVEDININANIDQIKEINSEQANRLVTIESAIDKLDTIKQNVIDNTLKTIANTIPNAINEVHDQLEVHEALTDNPHQVTWAQVNGTALNNTHPLMDGEASPGTLTTVSRSDHKHPTDTSRAPANHASTSTQYGKATTNEYGHVIVDSNISDSSENPAQNKVIKKYIDDVIAGLAINTVFLDASETLYSVSEEAGKISISKQKIQLDQSQVIDLKKDLETIDNDIHKVDDDSKNRDNILQNNINEVQENLHSESIRGSEADLEILKQLAAEASSRGNADISLSEQIKSTTFYLDEKINLNTNRIISLNETIETVYDMNESIQSIQETRDEENYYQKYALSFEPVFDSANSITGYKPIFTAMDDGELS